MQRIKWFPVLCALGLCVVAALALAAEKPLVAKATLKAAGEKPFGTVTFTQQADGVRVVVDVAGATPGKHGLHIHQNGECTPPFKTAGDHFNPDHADHSCPPTASRHSGDIGNLEVAADGTAHWEGVVDKISLTDPAHQITGKSVILHAKEDDCKTQPTGASGDRIACGVIEAAPQK
jgi:Cu-Zn family superoxide dismutase